MTSANRHPAGGLDARPAPALAMHLVLSTAHLTEDVAAVLDQICDTPDNRERPSDPTGTWADEVVSSPYRYGCWVRPFLDADPAEFPPCLGGCIAYARQHGATWILFDRDEPPIDELPSYDW